MNKDQSKPNSESPSTNFSRRIQTKAALKLKAKRSSANTIWFGLGMMGVIGWSIVIPTLLGIALGTWIDKTYSSGYSWTLMLLFIGLLIGCANAWYWLKKEDRQMHDDEEKKDE